MRETRLLDTALDKAEPLGDYANKFIRVGDDYQAVVPEETAPEHVSQERGDVLQDVQHTPLTAPPPLPPIPSLSAERAAAAAAAAAASLAAAPRRPSAVIETIEFDDDGEPVLPPGVAVGEGFCLAYGNNAGQRKQYKAVLLSVRTIFPPLLVKYVGDAYGRKDPLMMPEVRNSYVNLRDVSEWIPPEQRAAADVVPGAGEVPSASDDERRTKNPSRQARFVKPELQLLTEAGGLRLHLDPRRTADGYTGTGYRGVHDDYWHTGFKRDRPYVVVYEGVYQGRFATVEQAAVNYARLEIGMPPLVLEPQREAGNQPEAAAAAVQADGKQVLRKDAKEEEEEEASSARAQAQQPPAAKRQKAARKVPRAGSREGLRARGSSNAT